MARITSAIELKDYVLRQLGAPTIQIEVTEDQILDIIDDAVDLYIKTHIDGSDKTYIVIPITECIANQNFVQLPKGVLYVTRVLRHKDNKIMPYGMTNVASHTLNHLFTNTGGFDIISRVVYEQYMYEYREILDPQKRFEFNSQTGRFILLSSMKAGDRLILEVYTPSGCRLGDTQTTETEHNVPNENILDASWIKKYTIARTKKIWGSVLKKYSGQTMYGGASLNASEIYSEGVDELEKAEEELRGSSVYGVYLL